MENNFKKTIFLDRDGTINVDNGYVGRIDDFAFLENAIEGMSLMCKLGYQLVIITNQSGLARGFYDIKDYNELTSFYIEKLRENSVEIKNVYFCPHLKDATVDKYRVDCDCRKPKLGLYLKAIKDCNVDINNCICIGDKPRDLTLSQTYPSVKNILIAQLAVEGYEVAKDLLQAAKKISEGEV